MNITTLVYADGNETLDVNGKAFFNAISQCKSRTTVWIDNSFKDAMPLNEYIICANCRYVFCNGNENSPLSVTLEIEYIYDGEQLIDTLFFKVFEDGTIELE